MPNANTDEYREGIFYVIIYQTSRMKSPLVAVTIDKNMAKFEITEKKHLHKKSKKIKK